MNLKLIYLKMIFDRIYIQFILNAKTIITLLCLTHFGLILMSENPKEMENKLWLETLHETLPKPVKTNDIKEWIQWKTQMDNTNEKVWQMMSKKSKSFTGIPQIYEKMKKTKEKLNVFLEDERLIMRDSQSLESLVIEYYYESLRIISTHQTFELESPPFFEQLRDTSPSTLVKWVPPVNDLFVKTTAELHKLKKDREIWPFWALYETCQTTVDILKEYIGYSVSEVGIAFTFKPSLRPKNMVKLFPICTPIA